MNKEDWAAVSEKLSCLKGKELSSVSRDFDKAVFKFGAGQFNLTINGRFRVTKEDGIILTVSDMFEPSSTKENEPGYDFGEWVNDENDGWNKDGNNRFDEIIQKEFMSGLSGFVVSKVKVSRFGDLNINFANGFAMDVFIDESYENECWKFSFRADEKDGIIIYGGGILENE